MSVTLKPEMQRIVDDLIAEGYYESADAVIEAALVRLRADADADFDDGPITEEEKAAVHRSLADIAAGRVRPFKEAMAELRAKHLGTRP